MMKFYLLIMTTFVVFSCRKNDDDIYRAYAEGKMTSSLPIEKIEITIVNNNVVIAKTNPKGDLSFQLSGPMMNKRISIAVNQKIKSFSAVQSGLSISADSMKIVVPQEINYVKFNEIKLKQ